MSKNLDPKLSYHDTKQASLIMKGMLRDNPNNVILYYLTEDLYETGLSVYNVFRFLFKL